VNAPASSTGTETTLGEDYSYKRKILNAEQVTFKFSNPAIFNGKR